jgi:RND family efflux transporter MFP subunit
MRLRLAALALLSPLILSGCGAKKKTPPPPPPTVVVSAPLAHPIVDWDDYVGHFEAVSSVDVRPRVTGYLQSINFRDGEIVRAGQTLFVIDPRPYQAAYDQARAQTIRANATLATAKVELARYRTLFAGHAASQQDLQTRIATEQQSEADLAAAQATERSAALNLAFTRVTAPISGRVSDRKVASGNLVTADTTVLTNIVTVNPIRFIFTGAEGVYLKYQRENQAGSRLSSRRAANPVDIRLQDETTYRWHGRMDFVDNALDTNSGTIRGRAVVDNPGGFLTPGMFGHLRLMASGSYQGLLVPDQAVVTDQTRQVVYVVDGRGRVSQRLVEIGPIIDGLRVVRHGLASDDRVVIDGVQRAKPGLVVRVQQGRIEPQAPNDAPPIDDPMAASGKMSPAL